MPFRYGAAARFYHWTIAALVVVMFVLGIWITQFEPKDEVFKLRLYNWHESLGVVIFVLMILRLINRLSNPPAPLKDQPALIKFAAGANHLLLYALLLAQPVIGLLDTNAWGFPLKWFGLVSIPSPIGQQPEAIAQQLSDAHYYVALGIVLLVGMHLMGAAYHGLFRRDGVVTRML